MSSASPFRINVSDLVTHPGRDRRVSIDEGVDFAVELARSDPDRHLKADLELRAVSGGVMVQGKAEHGILLTCYRCLTEWPDTQLFTVRELVETIEDDDADYVLMGDEIDLEPILRDQATLELPLLPLCRNDCRGLCAICGADLNTGACSGHDDEIDSPFASLRELLEP